MQFIDTSHLIMIFCFTLVTVLKTNWEIEKSNAVVFFKKKIIKLVGTKLPEGILY